MASAEKVSHWPTVRAVWNAVLEPVTVAPLMLAVPARTVCSRAVVVTLPLASVVVLITAASVRLVSEAIALTLYWVLLASLPKIR